MTKTQKIIVLAAAVLIIIAFLFPPYRECPFNEKGEWIGKCYIKWAFNKNIQDIIRSETSLTSSGGIRFSIMEVEYPLMQRLLYLEIFGILVLAGGALLITKNRRNG